MPIVKIRGEESVITLYRKEQKTLEDAKRLVTALAGIQPKISNFALVSEKLVEILDMVGADGHVDIRGAKESESMANATSNRETVIDGTDD